MPKQKIIAFAAQMRNGKDTAADYLAKKLNSSITVHRNNMGYPVIPLLWERQSFANAVKNVFETSFDVDREFVEEWKSKPTSPDDFEMPIRQALQFIGDGFRKIKSNIWIDIALRSETPKILSDARYINELKTVYQKGGINVLLWRPGFENNDPCASEAEVMPIVNWASKTQKEGRIVHALGDMPQGAQYIHYFLKNDGDVDDLLKKVDEYLLPAVRKRWAK